ncbi:MAG: ABC transporter permease [Acidothermales bacterium]|nr:ABC transporter permease [Acidothermales bacterium]
MRAQFVLSEVGIGLRRNLTMTVAVIVAVAISVAFLGTALLFRSQVQTMKGFWYDKVEVAVFLCGPGSDAPGCATGPVTQQQRDQILAELQAMPEVEQVYYESQQEAFEHFSEQFADSGIVENVEPESLPESFRVKLRDAEQFRVIAANLAGRPGVEQIQDMREVLGRIFRVLNWFTLAAAVVAVVQLVAAMLLIANVIRVAAFSRRRETSIMRLVGASRFYIQLPFLLEGALAGLIGALLAAAGVVALQRFLVEDVLRREFTFVAFVGWDEVWRTIPLMLATGVVLAALASAVTVRKYLRV